MSQPQQEPAQKGPGTAPQGGGENSSQPGLPAGQDGTQPVSPGKDEARFTQADLDRIIASRVGPLQQKAAEYDKLLDSQKTEAQRQADALKALEAENAAFKAAETRRQAAAAANLPAEAHDLVTGNTPDEIDASIKKLAALLTIAAGPKTLPPNPSAGKAGVAAEQGGDWLRDRFATR